MFTGVDSGGAYSFGHLLISIHSFSKHWPKGSATSLGNNPEYTIDPTLRAHCHLTLHIVFVPLCQGSKPGLTEELLTLNFSPNERNFHVKTRKHISLPSQKCGEVCAGSQLSMLWSPALVSGPDVSYYCPYLKALLGDIRGELWSILNCATESQVGWKALKYFSLFCGSAKI